MKLNTQVWIRMQSKGRPKYTVTKQIVIHDAILEIARWLTDVYMGSRLEIIIARTEAELETRVKAVELDSNIVAELESLLGGTPEEEELFATPNPVCDDNRCLNPAPHEIGSADCTFKESE